MVCIILIQCALQNTTSTLCIGRLKSPVAENFNGDGHSQVGMAVMAIDQIEPRPMSPQNMGKWVDQNPEDLIPFGNEPHGQIFVKSA